MLSGLGIESHERQRGAVRDGSERRAKHKGGNVESTIIRQGDVLLKRVQKKPNGLKEKSRGRIVLAEGEVTGHAHVLTASDVVLMEDPKTGEMWLEVKSGDALLKHEEHAPHAVPMGIYEVVRQREYSPQEIRRVVD